MSYIRDFTVSRIYQEVQYNHNKTKQKKTECIFYGMYSDTDICKSYCDPMNIQYKTQPNFCLSPRQIF